MLVCQHLDEYLTVRCVVSYRNNQTKVNQTNNLVLSFSLSSLPSFFRSGKLEAIQVFMSLRYSYSLTGVFHLASHLASCIDKVECHQHRNDKYDSDKYKYSKI